MHAKQNKENLKSFVEKLQSEITLAPTTEATLAFLSYTRADDAATGGLITSLKDVLETDVRYVTGRPIEIFLDTDDIELGQDWRDRLESAIQNARFFMPVVTPSYFHSDPCTFELSRFHALEQAAARNDLILPVYLQTADVLEKEELRGSSPLATLIHTRNWADWRRLYPEPLESTEGKRLVRDLSVKIKSAIERAPPVPVAAMPFQRRVEQLETENAALTRDVANLRAGEVRIVELEASLENAKQESNKSRREADSAQQLVERTKRELAEEIETIRADNQALTTRSHQPTPSNAEVPSRRMWLWPAIGTAALSGLAGWWIGGLDRAGLETEIATREKAIDELENRNKDVVAELEQAQSEITELRQEVSGRGARIESLEAKVAELTPPPLPEPGTVFQDCEHCPEMIVVPAGKFTQGSPADEAGRGDDEGPQRDVAIAKQFAVGVHEVTFAEWDACVADDGCDHQPEDQWGRGRQPVMRVSWNDAQDYVSWLSTETGKKYRLLSEAEWEYLARAGTNTPFHFGKTISSDEANYNAGFVYSTGSVGEFRNRTVLVGEFSANSFGLHDVHGNVSEWVQDCYRDSYIDAPVNELPVVLGYCTRRILRGGSWNSTPNVLRSAYRSWSDPERQLSYAGFRVARNLHR